MPESTLGFILFWILTPVHYRHLWAKLELLNFMCCKISEEIWEGGDEF